MTPRRWQTYINASDTDIKNLRATIPPEAAEDFNDQYLIVLEGWRDVFTAMSNGSYEDQMLFDGQAEDDRLEDLQRELGAECG